MIYQNTQNENTQNQFADAIKELQLGKLLRKANISKDCGIPMLVPDYSVIKLMPGKLGALFIELPILLLPSSCIFLPHP